MPIPIFDASGKATLPIVKRGDVAKTDLDGSYTLAKVAPGDYFVVAEQQGYLSPVAQFPRDDLDDPTPDSIQRLAKVLPSVHVEPGKTVRGDAILERGASISGTVTFDDGSPVIRAEVWAKPACTQKREHIRFGPDLGTEYR